MRRDFSVAPAGAFSVVNLKPTARAVGYFHTLLRSFPRMKLRRQAFAVGLVVAVPAAQSGGAGVGKKKWQRRRFNVAVAKLAIKHTGQITSAVNHAGNFNAIRCGRVKNQIVANGKRTQPFAKFGA